MSSQIIKLLQLYKKFAYNIRTYILKEMSSLLFFSGIAGLVIAAFLYYADKISIYTGTFRFLHLFSPFGFNFKDIPNLQGKTYIVTGSFRIQGPFTTVLAKRFEN